MAGCRSYYMFAKDGLVEMYRRLATAIGAQIVPSTLLRSFMQPVSMLAVCVPNAMPRKLAD